MFLIYTIDAGNPRSPGERTVHCIDTDMPERFFVKDTTQGDRSVKKTVDMISDFMGDLSKYLSKSVNIAGIGGDVFGKRIIEDLIRQMPIYIIPQVKYATINRLFR
jgi:hypothetical protein